MRVYAVSIACLIALATASSFSSLMVLTRGILNSLRTLFSSISKGRLLMTTGWPARLLTVCMDPQVLLDGGPAILVARIVGFKASGAAAATVDAGQATGVGSDTPALPCVEICAFAQDRHHARCVYPRVQDPQPPRSGWHIDRLRRREDRCSGSAGPEGAASGGGRGHREAQALPRRVSGSVGRESSRAGAADHDLRSPRSRLRRHGIAGRRIARREA